jgi:mitochondrial fission protein ELM1
VTAAARNTQPLTVWTVSDGRAGIANQVLGLGEAVARLTPAAITVKTLRYAPLFDRWPTGLKLWPDAMLASESDRVIAPWPDIWIAAGRATLPHSRRMRHLTQGKTLVVQLQDPGEGTAFDLVIAPEHDQISGSNTLSLLGSTNRVTLDRMQADAAAWADRLAALPRPHLAVLIGGRSKTHDLSVERAEALAGELRFAVEVSGGALLLSLSRRTPEAARHVLSEKLKALPGLIYDGKRAGEAGDNPYFAFLDTADHILVTEDSVNMAAEAAVTGKPIHILAMDRLRSGGKFDRFHQALRDRGITRPFEGVLAEWDYAPLDETERAARRVLDVFNEKYPLRAVRA